MTKQELENKAKELIQSHSKEHLENEWKKLESTFHVFACTAPYGKEAAEQRGRIYMYGECVKLALTILKDLK